MTSELQNFQKDYKMKENFTNNTYPLENGMSTNRKAYLFKLLHDLIHE